MGLLTRWIWKYFTFFFFFLNDAILNRFVYGSRPNQCILETFQSCEIHYNIKPAQFPQSNVVAWYWFDMKRTALHLLPISDTDFICSRPKTSLNSLSFVILHVEINKWQKRNLQPFVLNKSNIDMSVYVSTSSNWPAPLYGDHPGPPRKIHSCPDAPALGRLGPGGQRCGAHHRRHPLHGRGLARTRPTSASSTLTLALRKQDRVEN